MILRNFESLFWKYIQELELKADHQGSNACFLNLDIFVKNRIFVYNLFDQKDTFPFKIVRIFHIDANIPKFIFYSEIKGES